MRDVLSGEITKHLPNPTVGANCVCPRETAGLPYEQNIPKQTNN